MGEISKISKRKEESWEKMMERSQCMSNCRLNENSIPGIGFNCSSFQLEISNSEFFFIEPDVYIKLPLNKVSVLICWRREVNRVAILSIRQFESKSIPVFELSSIVLVFFSHPFIEVHHVVFTWFHGTFKGSVGEESADAELDHLVVLREQVAKFSCLAVVDDWCFDYSSPVGSCSKFNCKVKLSRNLVLVTPSSKQESKLTKYSGTVLMTSHPMLSDKFVLDVGFNLQSGLITVRPVELHFIVLILANSTLKPIARSQKTRTIHCFIL
jgi:hypothetical protein